MHLSPSGLTDLHHAPGHDLLENAEPDIDLHLSTAGRHAAGVHPRVNIGSAGWVNNGSARTPHTIRHTTARHLLQSGEPIDGIALWLGHESPTTTHQYTEANLAMKEKALARVQDPDTGCRRFRASDSLLEFLKGL